MAATEGLADFRSMPPATYREKSVAKKQSPTKAGKKKSLKKKDATTHGAKESKSKPVKAGECFICGGPHRAVACPKKEKVSALTSHEDEDFDSVDEGPSRVNPMQLLNALAAKHSSGRELLYVMVRVNGREVKAMINTGQQTTSSRKRRHKN